MSRRHWVLIQAALVLTLLLVAVRMAGPPKVFAIIGLVVLMLMVAVASRVHTARRRPPG